MSPIVTINTELVKLAIGKYTLTLNRVDEKGGVEILERALAKVGIPDAPAE